VGIFSEEESENLNILDAGWILHFSEYYLLHGEPILGFCEDLVDNISETTWGDAMLMGIQIGNLEIVERGKEVALNSGVTLEVIERVMRELHENSENKK
jgi:hypothetical protein